MIFHTQQLVDGQPRVVNVEGKAVILKDCPHKFFVYKKGALWHVIHGDSGWAVAANTLRKWAVRDAQEKWDTKKDKFEALVKIHTPAFQELLKEKIQ